jgi:stringent starvation protein B
MNDTSASKEAVVLKLLEEGDTMLCLDARHQGVQVPPQHAQNPALRLILSLHFPQPIEVTTEGVSANLSFAGRRFHCYVPMSALWAAFNPHTGQGTMWPESMPSEVLADLAKSSPHKAPQAAPPVAAEPQAPLQIVDQQTTEGEPAPKPPRQRGHLRIIK